MPDGPGKVAAERALVADLEAARLRRRPTGNAGHACTSSPEQLSARARKRPPTSDTSQGKQTTAVKPSTAEGVRTADLNVEGIGRVDIYAPSLRRARTAWSARFSAKEARRPWYTSSSPRRRSSTPAEVARFPGRIFGHPTAGKGISRSWYVRGASCCRTKCGNSMPKTDLSLWSRSSTCPRSRCPASACWSPWPWIGSWRHSRRAVERTGTADRVRLEEALTMPWSGR